MKKVLLPVLVVVLVAVLGGWFVLDTLVKGAIEEGSTRALGVPVQVGGVDLGILAGEFSLEEYRVDNPEGWEGDEFFAVDFGGLSVGLRSLLSDTVRVESLEIRSVRLNAQLDNTRSNVRDVLGNLKAYQAEHEPASDRGKRLLIEDLWVRDVTATLAVRSAELGLDRVDSVSVGEIHLVNVGGDRGATVAQITDLVLTRVVERVIGSPMADALRRQVEGEVHDLLREQTGLTGTSKDEILDEVKDKAEEEAKGLLRGVLDQ
jgi:hypothetical protein